MACGRCLNCLHLLNRLRGEGPYVASLASPLADIRPERLCGDFGYPGFAEAQAQKKESQAGQGPTTQNPRTNPWTRLS